MYQINTVANQTTQPITYTNNALCRARDIARTQSEESCWTCCFDRSNTAICLYFFCCLPCALISLCCISTEKPELSKNESKAINDLFSTLCCFSEYVDNGEHTQARFTPRATSEVLPPKQRAEIIINAIDNTLSLNVVVKLRSDLERIRATVASAHGISLIKERAYEPPIHSATSSSVPARR